MDETILMCSICPGQPHFSDVSHLLTHAASKAHLASHFKLKLRTDDPNAIELLKQYDDWFDANGYAKQLSARMASKEIRKKRKSDDALASAAKHTSNRALNVEIGASSTTRITTTPVSDCLDPRLADSHNDKQQHAETTPLLPTTPNRLPMVNSNVKSRTGPILRSMRSSNGTKSDVMQPVNASGPTDEKRSLALPVTPIQRRGKPDPLERTWVASRETPDPFIDSGDQTQASGDPEMDKSRAEEIARLKGVLWPGMDIFDSATLQMRRRRNQKKDGAVLKMMERTSSLVEPTEQVFSSHGGLLKERIITGNVEEYSPLKGETPIPRRGIVRTRSTRLTKADPNVPRAVDRKRQKADKDRKNMKGEAKEERSFLRRSRRAADRTHSYVGDDEEFGLTVNTFGKRPRGGFGIFVDEEKEEEESKSSYPDPGFRTQFDTLTPTRLVLNGKTNTGRHALKIGHSSVDKENIEPILNPQGRIGPHSWHSPFARRNFLDDFGFDPPCLPDLGDPYDGFDKVGYRSNPLQAPSKHPFYDSQYEEEHTAQNGWLSIDQTVPSEETIPEDEHLFSGYYLTTDAN